MGPVKTEEALEQCCGAGSRWSRNYLGPGAGAEIKFLINIFCSQFGGCYDEDKLISSSVSIVLHFRTV